MGEAVIGGGLGGVWRKIEGAIGAFGVGLEADYEGIMSVYFEAYDDSAALWVFIESGMVFSGDGVGYVDGHSAARGTPNVVSGWVNSMAGVADF